MLLERDHELEALSELLATARAGRGCLVLVEGPAGVGKSSLLEHCQREAARHGLAVLSVRGDELVMESSFAAVRELLWPAVGERRANAFEGAARLALPVFEGMASGEGDRDRASAVLYGLHWLVAELADERPLLLLIDDAQWLDPASARFLVYLAHRLEPLPILVAVAIRQGEAGALSAELSAAGHGVLHPASLSEEASATVVRDMLGPRADDDLCRSCHEAARGNPFYLRELAAALRAEGGRPGTELARHVRELGVATIRGSVLVRLARLGADCERLAEALSVLGPGASLRHAAELASLSRDRAQAAADALRSADVLAAEARLSFVHPLVAEVVSNEVPPARRALLHGAAASLLDADGAPADRVAAHLLLGEPYGDEWVVDALRRSAREALARGAPEAAVSHLRRALAEPPPPRLRGEVLLSLGRAEALLPQAHDFPALREALELAETPVSRAEIALELALGLCGVLRNADAAAVIGAALQEHSELDEYLVERLDQVLLVAGADDFAQARSVLARMTPYLERARRGELADARMLASLASTGTGSALDALEGAALARRALSDDRLLYDWLEDGYVSATLALARAGDLEEAARAAERGLAEAQRRGSAPMFLQLSLVRADTAVRAGDLGLAQEYSERAAEVGGELGVADVAAMFLAVVAAERGEIDQASSLIERMEIPCRSLNGCVMLAERGRIRIAHGELSRGLEDILGAERATAEAGFELGVECDWLPAAAVALSSLARGEEAACAAQRERRAAARFGAARRFGIALSVCGSLDHGQQGLAWLREAVEVLDRSPARLEHARSLVNLGSGLLARRQRQAAREPLSLGLDMADRCGAQTLAERARSELVAAGARPRRPSMRGAGSLTPAELRVARMAAEGMSNKEIAQALFISIKTVETQLSRAFAKLGVPRRAELAAALRRA